MGRKKLEVTKHSLNLREGDYDYLRQYCVGKHIEASDIIRAQVSKIVDALRKAEETTRTFPEIDEVQL